MKSIHISVREAVAFQTDKTAYLCGDGDFSVVFDLDGEWDALPVRTARFQTENGFTDVSFRGDTCPIPVIPYARRLEIGVYAGNLKTTTPASVFLKAGIRSAWGAPEDPLPSVYDQLMEHLMDSSVELETLQDGVRLTVRYRGGAETCFLRHSEVYVGSGEMPEGYRVQLDPSTAPPVLRVRDTQGNYIPLPSIRGEKGEKGDKGDPGPQGPKGDLGEGVVRSVNGVEPDGDGAVSLTPAQLGALSLSGGTMTGALSLGGFRLSQLAPPTASTDGANKAYVDGKRLTMTALLDTGWTGSGPYTQVLEVAGIRESDMPHITPVYDDQKASAALYQKESWGCVSAGVAQDGGILFTCLEDKPETPIPIQIEVMR